MNERLLYVGGPNRKSHLAKVLKAGRTSALPSFLALFILTGIAAPRLSAQGLPGISTASLTFGSQVAATTNSAQPITIISRSPSGFVYETPVPLADSRWKLQEIWSNQASSCMQGAGIQARVLGAAASLGGLTTFDVPSSSYGTFAVSINSSGAIAGYNTDALNSNNAFLRDKNGSVAIINPPGTVDALLDGAIAYGINDAGDTAGVYVDTNFSTHGFIRDKGGALVIIDAPNASNPYGTQATCINVDGAIAGDYFDASPVRHGFVRSEQGVITTFDAPGAGSGIFGTRPVGINTSGVITGIYFDANSVAHGFVRDQHGFIAMFDAPGAGTLPGAGTFAEGINDDGEIVGYYTDALFRNHGYIRDARGVVTTFDAPNAVYGTFAYSINASGVVAGYYSDAGGFPAALCAANWGTLLWSTPMTTATAPSF